MHDDELVGEVGEHAGRRGAAADASRGCGPRSRSSARRAARPVRRRAARGRRPASRTRSATAPSSGTIHTPSTEACAAPARTAPESARWPSSSPRPVTTMVLPAPVSPVIAVKPGPDRQRGLRDHAEIAQAHLFDHSADLADRQPCVGSRAAPSLDGKPELAHETVGERGGCRRASRTGPLERRTTTRAPGGRSCERRPSHHSTPVPLVRSSSSIATACSGPTTRGLREQRVRRQRHDSDRLDRRPDHRTAGREVVRGRAGRRRDDDAVAAEAWRADARRSR